MVDIFLHNSRSRKRERFTPLDPNRIGIYVCGPTVYDRAHMGNARPVVVFDVLYRLMRTVYGAGHVTYVRNFTDVDDKINAKSAQTGRPISDITEETIAWYLDDMAQLGALQPDHMPRATAYIGQMITMIEGLIDRGHAYAAQGHVLFRVRSYTDYGALSGRSVDDMIAGARVEVAPFKEDPMDFVLWKPSDSDQPGWNSPWGRGRPGWHIECSAMSHDILGDSFDIHAGGNDLMFPHHENEIAQSCCAHPEGQFANIWLHNEMLLVEGKKMSKSLGNFFTVRQLLDQGIPGEVIRFVFLGTHYRKPMDWTAKKAEDAQKTLRKWRSLIAGAGIGQVDPKLLELLGQDLNTPGALAHLDKMAKACAAGQVSADDFRASAAVLGLLSDDLGGWYQADETVTQGDLHFTAPADLLSMQDAVFTVLAAWRAARLAKDFDRADHIRQLCDGTGLSLRASKDSFEAAADAQTDGAAITAAAASL